MTRTKSAFATVVFCLLLPLVLYGCDGGGNSDDVGATARANPAFNGTFRGNITTTQGGQDFVDMLTVTVTVGSPFRGTFSTSISSGTISGEATGNSAMFTGTFDFNGNCRGTITNGSAMLTNDNTLSFNLSGSDCNGLFISMSRVTRAGSATPVANAGPDQNVTTGTRVTLDGRGSSDADGDPLTFAWAFVSVPAGSTATLTNPTAVNPTFMADVAGSYVVRLVVNDRTVESPPDTVTITATAATANAAPMANAGPDQSVPTGTLVTLGGQGSSDANGDPLTFAWAFVSVPAGSTATLTNSTTVNPTFTANVAGAYVVRLVVNDTLAESPPDTVTIMASTANAAPTANAGPDQNVTTGTLVTLDGRNSSDANGDPLTFAWSFVSMPTGSTATLSTPTAVNPTFTANVAGAYVVRLVVNDTLAESPPDTVTIMASTANAAPIANAGPDQNVTTGTLVTLDGRNSSDANGDPLTFAWAFVSMPTGSTATLSTPTAVNPTFTANVAGAYVVRLVVNDTLAESPPDTVTISAATDQPVARISTPSSVADERTEVRLDGSGSSTTQGTIASYSWVAVDHENVQLEIANANQPIATLRIGEATTPTRVSIRLTVTSSTSQTGAALQELDVREVDEARLPPDPGENGRSTVEGIDANGNNLRDDVERAIYDLHKDSMEDRAVMMMAADMLEDAVMSGVAGSTMNPDTVADNVSRGVDCLFKRASLQPRQALAVLKALVVNTPERLAAYKQYDSSRDGTVQQPTEATNEACMAFAQ